MERFDLRTPIWLTLAPTRVVDRDSHKHWFSNPRLQNDETALSLDFTPTVAALDCLKLHFLCTKRTNLKNRIWGRRREDFRCFCCGHFPMRKGRSFAKETFRKFNWDYFLALITNLNLLQSLWLRWRIVPPTLSFGGDNWILAFRYYICWVKESFCIQVTWDLSPID